MKISIPDFISKAISVLEINGYEAYVVGGCVRDAYLCKIPNDWDVTTSATPDEMKKVFESFKVIETGIKHGTLSVIIDEQIVEITTMRVDGEYSDNRHPDSVEFTRNIESDLARRDFTVNAMAYNLSTGLVDPFNGRGDIDKKIIKCVGDPDKRFNEDALRIIRGLRFSSVLDFDIDKATAESMLKNKALLNNVAKERVRVELLKLLCGIRVKSVLMDFAPVIFEIIPELSPMYNFPQNTPYHIFDVWEHTAVAVDSIKPDPILRMAMLLHDSGKPEKHKTDRDGTDHFKFHQQLSFEKSKAILKKLRFSNSEIEEISNLVLYHDWRPDGDEKKILVMASELTPEFLLRLMPVLKADILAKNPDNIPNDLTNVEKTQSVVADIIKNKPCISIKDLCIDGNDLIKLGFKGKEIGEILKRILFLIIDGQLKNNQESVLTYIKKNINCN